MLILVKVILSLGLPTNFNKKNEGVGGYEQENPKKRTIFSIRQVT